MDREQLESHGIEPEYIDIWGQTHVVSDEVASAILKSLGDAPRDAATIVVRESAEAISVRIPSEKSGASLKLEIEWESPDIEHKDIEHHWYWLPELPTLESHADTIVKRVPLPRLRLGYHRARFYWMQEPELQRFSDSRFIVCPERCLTPDRRMAGVALSLYGLRSSRNWGIGDFTDLLGAIDAFAGAGAQFIALNPLHAIPNRSPYNTSPYLPQCSFYRNWIYLDVEKIGATAPPEAAHLRATEFVDYEAVARIKLTALRRLFDEFAGSPDFDRYVESEGKLLRLFAAYCVLDEEMHRRDPNVWLWTDWPREFQNPLEESVGNLLAKSWAGAAFFAWLQWHVDLQLSEAQAHAKLRGMSIGLYHDLALATDRFGADLWAFRDFYASGARVGAPPDDFSPNGQDWSFPPPNRDAHKQNGYELFVQSIRKNARHGGALRIDHVMRFFRLYWIPDGFDARNGAYVRDYADDLLGILALESVRGNFIVIGEDLGTVAPDVRYKLAQNGILSYRLLWFEKHGDGSFKWPHDYPENAAVSTTTHDLPTLAGFYAKRDIEARREAGMIDDEEYRRQMDHRGFEIARLNEALERSGFASDPLGFLLATPSLLAIVNQEDLTGKVEQQNLPGTTWQHPNWKRKMNVAVEDFGPLVDRLRDKIIFSKR